MRFLLVFMFVCMLLSSLRGQYGPPQQLLEEIREEKTAIVKAYQQDSTGIKRGELSLMYDWVVYKEFCYLDSIEVFGNADTIRVGDKVFYTGDKDVFHRVPKWEHFINLRIKRLKDGP
jgi:hypothetical protein